MSEVISPNTAENPELVPLEESSTRHRRRKLRFLVSNDEGTLVFNRSHLYAVMLPLAFVLGLSVGFLFWGRTQPPAGKAVAAAPAVGQPTQPPVQRYNVPVDDDPAIGPPDAPITIIEFSDFQCPYCKRWHNEVYGRLMQEYQGKVRVVFRDFPLSSIHPDAESAAEAADCANEQGAFWEYHDKLFNGDQLGQTVYLQYAQELGLDMDKFKTCVDTGRYKSEVAADYDYASNLGVRSTPTFFLNGLPIVGAQPYDVFKQVIEQELAGEIP